MRDVLRARIVDGRVSADDILPGRLLRGVCDPADLAPHVFEDRLPGFADTIGAGDMLVGAAAFGTGRCGEGVVAALRACGVRMVAAPDFGRSFFRHCWNLGVPAVRTEVSNFVEGQLLGVDLAEGIFTGAPALPTFPPAAPVLLDLVTAGGLWRLPHRTPATYATITPLGRARRPGRRSADRRQPVAALKGASRPD